MSDPPCWHNSVGLAQQDVVCYRCGEVVTWPPPLRDLVERVPSLTPADLPETPWALHTSAPRVIGKSRTTGGPYESVLDNTAWLEGVKREVSQGARSPRYRMGTIQFDLYSLARVLRELEPQRSYW